MSAQEKGLSSFQKTLQKGSGLVIFGFALFHLLNVVAAAQPGGYDAVQGVLRKIYQFPPLELPLMVAIAIHAAVSILGIWRRTSPTSRLPWRTRLHRYAGWYLLVVMLGHILAVRGLALKEGTPPRFAGLTFSLAWLPLYFIPYYAGLGVLGCYHALHGAGTALASFGWSSAGKATSRLWFRAGIVVFSLGILLGIAGMMGRLYAIADPFDNPYAAIYRRMFGTFVPEPGSRK